MERKSLFDTEFERIILCIPERGSSNDQGFVDEIRNLFEPLEVVLGLPNIQSLHLTVDKTSPKLLILEDLMVDALKNEKFLQTMTYDSHHSNITLLMTMQNFFFQAKNAKTFLRNFNIKVIFNDAADVVYLRTISQQISGNPYFLKNAFEKLETKLNTGEMDYLLIDSNGRLPKKMLVRARIFPCNDGKVRPIFFML